MSILNVLLICLGAFSGALVPYLVGYGLANEPIWYAWALAAALVAAGFFYVVGRRIGRGTAWDAPHPAHSHGHAPGH
jgi:hypothetical protein